jgi:hypothetical protein
MTTKVIAGDKRQENRKRSALSMVRIIISLLWLSMGWKRSKVE